MNDLDFEVLPVEAFKDDILRAVRRHQIIICTGETGSGKTTQLPKYFMQAGYATEGRKIAVTQPRRIAAISVAQRVSDELNSPLGKEVGYVVRFEEKISDDSKIKFMTDGILIRECLSDRRLSQYSLIMIDEAHERSLNTDILFGLLKECCRMRRDLKVVITSATLDTVKFGAYFNNCPIIQVPGRNFPVDIYHSKAKQIMTESGPANNSYIDAAVEVVLKIHRREADGHILVFLTGQDEIEKACQSIEQALKDEQERIAKEGGQNERELIVLPLYAALSNDIQAKVFQKPEYLWAQRQAKQQQQSGPKNNSNSTREKYIRKCIIATNIAETSITVPHIRFVVDAGYVKQKVFDPERGMESLLIVPVSKTASLQRAGRAGRTGPGQCYRLYSSECFDRMLDETIPEIQRTSLAHTVLYLKALGISDVLHFDFLDPPSSEQVIQALHLLYMLQAINNKGNITPLGHKMSQFPLEPPLSRMLIQAATLPCNCLSDMVIICAMLSVENVWITPRAPRPTGKEGTQQQLSYQQRKNASVYGSVGFSSQSHAGDARQPHVWSAQEEAAETAHAGLRHAYGDFHTLHRVFIQWERADFTTLWCERHFVSARAMKQARKIRDHLSTEVDKYRIRQFAEDRQNDLQLQILYPAAGQEGVVSTANNNHPASVGRRWEDRVSEAVLAGYYMHAAVTCHSETLYKCVPLPNAQQAAAEARRHAAKHRGVSRPDKEEEDAEERDLDFGGYEARLVHLHPQSALCHVGNPPEIAPCVVYRELVHSSGKLYLRGVAKVSGAQYKRYRRAFQPVSVAQLSQEDTRDTNGLTDGTDTKGSESVVLEKDAGKKRSLDELSQSDDVGGKISETAAAGTAAVDDARARYLARKKK